MRALYEDSAVPVAEIARLVGVSGRTIYKYARKHRWKPRYRWNAEGARPRGAKRSAGGDFAPVKGAGSRFIRRADKGKPFANGLKATDPAAAAHAAAQCTQAQLLARAAQAQAEAARRAERHVRAIDAANRALGDLSRFRATRALHYRGRAWPALDLRFERAFLATAEAALRQWEFLLAQG